MTEEWRAVVGYEGLYEVSSLGRVRSLDRTVPYSGGTPRRVKGREIRCEPNANGYPRVSLSGRKFKLIHVLVAEAFLGPKPELCEVRHLNGNRADPRLSNLAYGTQSENAHDCYDYGGRSGRGKLFREEILEIRRRLSEGETQTSLAKAYNVTRQTIGNIKSGKTFSYIK